MIAGQAKPRDPPAGDIAEAKRAASGNDARERRATGVGRPENAANTGSGDAGDGDLMLLKHLEHTQVRETPRKASTKGEANTWPRGRYCPVAQSGLVVVHHATEHANFLLLHQWTPRPEKTVPMYLTEKGERILSESQTVPPY
jgi:hypothetical protein